MSRVQLEALLAELAAGVDDGSPFTVDKARRTWYAFTDDYRPPADVELVADPDPGSRLEWVTRRGLVPKKAVLYLHGGGYLCGSARSHRAITCGLAQCFDGTVANLDYRLAPEHPFPAQLEEALRAYDAILGRGYPPNSIGIAGDSAGGGLVMSLILELRRQSRTLPGAGWCISPWLDLTSRIGRISSNVVRDPIVFADVLDTASHIYLNGHSAHDPLVAPSSADLRGVPPLLLQVGSGELLLDDSLQLAKLAEIAGVDVTLEIWPDMLHAWHLFAGTLSEAAEATHRGAEWLDRKLSS